MSSSCTSGTSPRSSPRSAGCARAAAVHAALPRHPSSRGQRSERDPAFDLDGYDGVLAFGEALADVYRRGAGASGSTSGTRPRTRASSARPPSRTSAAGLVWIGNWGDDERSAELESSSLVRKRVGLPLDIYGVRYPAEAWRCFRRYGAPIAAGFPMRACRRSSRAICDRSCAAPALRDALPGIPTIRVFEALACGIPLVSAPWRIRKACSGPARISWSRRDERRDGAPSGRARTMPICARSLVENGFARDPQPSFLRAPGRPTPRYPRNDGGADPDGDARMKIAFYGRAFCPPTGTALRPTTGGCRTTWPAGGTVSPSTSRTHSTDRSTANRAAGLGGGQGLSGDGRCYACRRRRRGPRRRRGESLAASASSMTRCWRGSSRRPDRKRLGSSGTSTRLRPLRR